jgi:hypothetical protein
LFVRSFATRRDATLERRRSWRRGRALVDADFPRGGIEPESVELSFVARFRASLANGGDTDAGGVFLSRKDAPFAPRDSRRVEHRGRD